MKHKFLLAGLMLLLSLSLSAQSGTCGAQGDNLSWELSCDGVLTINGEGEMKDDKAPWSDIKEQILSVIIEDGVTSIGIEAFSGCSNLTAVELPNSIGSIHYGAFSNCTNLTHIDIPNN